MKMQQIRLVIMCEPRGIRRGLSAIFASADSFKVMGEVGCGPDSIAEAQKIQPDVIIVEIAAEEEIGKLLLLVKESCPYTKVLMFIKNDTVSEARAAILAGADGCLSKTMLPGHLVKAVELTCRAAVVCLPSSLKRLLNRQKDMGVQLESQSNAENMILNDSVGNGKLNWKFPITPREMEIYKLIVQNCSNKEIGEKLFISQPTVKSHVSSILRKMGLSSRTQLVLYDMHNKF